MSLIKSLLFTLLLAAAAVQASTRDEIERLWNPQGMAAQPAQPAAGTSARTEKPEYATGVFLADGGCATAGLAPATSGRQYYTVK